MTEQFLKCPDCNCLFLTQSDLNKHLATFGEKHAKALKELHQATERNYCSCEFDDADKTQRDIEKAIEEYANGGTTQ